VLNDKISGISSDLSNRLSVISVLDLWHLERHQLQHLYFRCKWSDINNTEVCKSIRGQSDNFKNNGISLVGCYSIHHSCQGTADLCFLIVNKLENPVGQVLYVLSVYLVLSLWSTAIAPWCFFIISE
jgi:hypothetical protein